MDEVGFRKNATSAQCRFFVHDDDIPEGNETFPINLSIVGGKGSIDNSSYSVITIVQNDDPFGCVGFNTPGRITSITADEPKNNEERLVSFNVTRYGGKIGPILVYWKVF